MPNPETPSPRRPWARLAVVATLLMPMGGAMAFAQTPEATTPGTTPTSTTPTTPAPSTPVPTTPNLGGAATAATITWTPPASIVEESKFTLKLDGTVNGQATAHVALLKDAAACPSSPLYPMQTATGTKVTVVALPASVDATTPGYLGGTVSHTLSLSPKDSGTYSLCGWLVGSPASSEASTVARFSQVVGVANRPAAISAEIPASVRSGDYFSVKLSGTTPASGRRVLIMAEKDLGKRCEGLRKAASGKLPLQTVVGLPSGTFTKTLRLRFRTKSAGPYQLCVQVVETVDRNPEAFTSGPMEVGEGLKCVSTQSALTQRSTDLGVIRKRRDSALGKLTAAKKQVAPAKAKVSAATKVAKRRIAAARKAVTRAKSKAGKQKAKRRLAQVRKTENARIYKAGAPLRKANASVRLHDRTYKQYRTGARLLDETITRTKKDLKKYCAGT